jgi:hypothetical protein
MENIRRKAYDAAFKLKAINLVVEEGNQLLCVILA